MVSRSCRSGIQVSEESIVNLLIKLLVIQFEEPLIFDCDWTILLLWRKFLPSF